MAIVRKLREQPLERDARHTEVDATYCIVRGEDDERFLQIDTYGSSGRKVLGKKSQSIRFSSEAVKQLREILQRLG